MKLMNQQGKVIFASAGPGDPDLLTIKAARYLRQADVVLADRLVSDEILNHYVGLHARVIHVGKQCGKAASVKQSDINGLLLEYAQQGKLVVRLKGGDASIFSNILDELQTLQRHQIDYEIIPGITAALGAAAYAGIPLTARGYAISVRFLTFYKNNKVDETYWQELAQTNDTLVFYMSSLALDEIVARLVEQNIAEDKLLAVVEQATTPLQNVYVSNLYSHHEKQQNHVFTSPSLVIIGKVVALHEKFGWLANSNSKKHYFKPVDQLPYTLPLNTKEKQDVS